MRGCAVAPFCNALNDRHSSKDHRAETNNTLTNDKRSTIGNCRIIAFRCDGVVIVEFASYSSTYVRLYCIIIQQTIRLQTGIRTKECALMTRPWSYLRSPCVSDGVIKPRRSSISEARAIHSSERGPPLSFLVPIAVDIHKRYCPRASIQSASMVTSQRALIFDAALYSVSCILSVLSTTDVVSWKGT